MNQERGKSWLEELQERESNFGRIYRVAGPLVVAAKMAGARMNEVVKVGWNKLCGEIIKLDGDTASIQCYEDTSGLSVKDPVMRTKQPLLVELGPGILSHIFDGIQRPLDVIGDISNSIYMPKGIDIPALDQKKQWHFIPKLKVGSKIFGGDIYGTVFENNLFTEHRILAAPTVKGIITYIAPEGEYTLADNVLEIEYDGYKESFGMSHFWPVREARPFLEKLQGNAPLLTGQRVLDVLYPSVLGGKCCIPGAFGCGKTCITQALTQYANCECSIYVGCGERANEMTEILLDFPEMCTMNKGRQENIMQRTCLVANTSNMPVAGREASIHTGITIAEYFRDMGYNISLMADSTSRWVEALGEISARLGEMPSEQGYPAYLSSRIAQFYERGGRVKCIGSPDREGSITIVGAVSPRGGNFEDPFTTATLQLVDVFWGLDKKLAQRRHFPAINWNISYSHFEKQLECYFSEYDADFPKLLAAFKKILYDGTELLDLLYILGRDSFSEQQKLTLQIFTIIREDFLQQNSFSYYDNYCPLWKTIGMMKCIVFSHEQGLEAMTNYPKAHITCYQMNRIINKLSRMKFQDPKTPRQDMMDQFSKLREEIYEEIRMLTIK